MAEIGIHVDDVAIAMLDRITQAGDNRGPQAELSLAMQAMNSRVGRRLLVAPAASAVGRVIVDHQEVNIRSVAEDFVDQPWEVLDFVIRGRHDQRFRFRRGRSHVECSTGTGKSARSHFSGPCQNGEHQLGPASASVFGIQQCRKRRQTAAVGDPHGEPPYRVLGTPYLVLGHWHVKAMVRPRTTR